MAKDRKISQEKIADKISGDELIPFSKNRENGAVSTGKILEKAKDDATDLFAPKKTVNDLEKRVDDVEQAQSDDLAKITELSGKLNGVENLSDELSKIPTLQEGSKGDEKNYIYSDPTIQGKGAIAAARYRPKENGRLAAQYKYWGDTDFNYNTEFPQATTTTDGVMSASDKSNLEGIIEKIPSQASAENQLADKDFVNSSIATNTAEFKGTHNSLEELQIIAADANDYGFVVSKDSDGNTVYNRYKYVEGQGWVFEYALNNSSFTAAQWAAIQSGITSGDVAKIKELDKELETLGFTVETLNAGLGEANVRIEDLESEKAKKAVFIDLWNKACGNYGKYNEQTGFFELNGLTDITYEQALEIYNAGPIEGTAGYARYRTSNIRTNLPTVGSGDVVTLTNTFHRCTNLEFAFVEVANTAINSFNDCSKLRVIGRLDGFASSLYNINASGADNTTFRNCASLEMVYGMIKSANPNIYVADCPKLTLENFQFWVKNASNTIAVTITVHPDVYAKLTDTGNSEWNALLSEAAEKQISFATI